MQLSSCNIHKCTKALTALNQTKYTYTRHWNKLWSHQYYTSINYRPKVPFNYVYKEKIVIIADNNLRDTNEVKIIHMLCDYIFIIMLIISYHSTHTERCETNFTPKLVKSVSLTNVFQTHNQYGKITNLG